MSILKRILITLTGLAALLTTACDNTTAPCPYVAAGRIVGTVTTGGLPIDATIKATRIVAGFAQQPAFETRPDEEGHYSLDVPAGDYVIRLAIAGFRAEYDVTPGGLARGETTPDTLLVADSTSPVQIDFGLGSVIFSLGVSPELNGERGRILLYPEGPVDLSADLPPVGPLEAPILNGQMDIAAAGIIPGNYRVEVVLGRRDYLCYCPYDGEHFWLPGVRDAAQATVFTVGADSVVSLTGGTVFTPAQLAGRLTGAWLERELKPAPEIMLVTPDSLVVLGQRRVADDGVFHVDLQVPEPVKLAVTYQGFVYWVGGPGFTVATVFDLMPGSVIDDLEVSLGTIQLSAPGFAESFAGVDLEVRDPADGRLLGTAALNPTSGGFKLVNLWPGQFLLRVAPMRYSRGQTWWRPQWYDRAADISGATAVTLPVGGQATVEFLLETGGVIAGDLALPTDEGQRYSVIVTSATTAVITAHDYLSILATGFRVSGLEDGTYRLGAVPWGGSWDVGETPPAGTVWYPGTLAWEAATAITISDAAEVTSLVIPAP